MIRSLPVAKNLSVYFAFLIGAAFLLICLPSPARSASEQTFVTGTVYDAASDSVIPHVTVQVAGGGRATKANADGRFRLKLPPGHYDIKISHDGYYSQSLPVTVATKVVELDIRLRRSIYRLNDRRVYSRAYDPAQRIIAEAIRRKEDILSQLHDYSFDAYTKLVVSDADKPDSQSIMAITETRVTSYWEQPDKYKEVITARKQSANIGATSNLVTVGDILNFNRNRIDLERYQVVSPTATDAMDHYNYYLLDTVYLDQHPVFVLEVEPKNRFAPLFVGEIQIADSTYDVVKVDVGFSEGLEFPMLDSARYHQSFAQIDGRYWLPVEIGFSGQVSFDIPFPGIPRRIGFSHLASIYEYRIETGHAEGTFGEYDIEVAEEADDYDSAAWAELQMVPLTELELRGYERIDSVEAAPKPFYKHLLKGLAAGVFIVTMGDPTIFHFNRVEGPYLGYGTGLPPLIPDLWIWAKAGYAFEDHDWQYAVSGSYELWKRQKFRLYGGINDEITHRPTIITGANYNPTANALLFKIDPFDYYRQKGYWLGASIKPLNQTRFSLSFSDYAHFSKSRRTEYGVFRSSITPRPNVPIMEGKMRSVSLWFRYDSRKLINNKGDDIRLGSSRYVRLETGLTYSSPDFAGSDFSFRRYFVRLTARTRLSGLGTTRLTGYAGASDGDLPPQRYFIVDFHDPDFFSTGGFNTVEENNFGGDRAAAIFAVHTMGAHMFRNSGIEFLQKIPWGLSLHGGAFWAEFTCCPTMWECDLNQAPTAYTEIGFGLHNLTPFLLPFNLAVNFTWQLSAYETDKFSFLFDFRL